LREGNEELAKLFKIWKKIDRETNPTEFVFAHFAKAKHRSFDEKWAKSAHCWPTLDPLLFQVRELAAELSPISPSTAMPKFPSTAAKAGAPSRASSRRSGQNAR
jgi:hypothetical protein